MKLRLDRWRAQARQACEPVLASYAAVLFSSDVRAGALLFVASWLVPLRALAGFLAVLSANRTARAFGYAPSSVSSGFYGYGALLLAFALYHAGGEWPRLLLLAVAGGAACALLTAASASWLARVGLPVLALPFVLSASLLGRATLSVDPAPPWLNGPSVSETPLNRLLSAIGAILFEPTPMGGVLVLVAAFIASRATSLCLVLGAGVGLVGARSLAASDPMAELAAAYNAALASALVGCVALLPSRASLLSGAGAAALSAWLALAWPFAGTVPLLAWPFLLVSWLVLAAMQLRPVGRVPAFAPLPHASPEANVSFARMLELRLLQPGPPLFFPPCAGSWTITQGFDGPHTHRGDWAHALDFEICDSEGFPFAADGTKLEHYYCFGKPVLAPAAGTVVALFDGAPDNRPGTQDLAQPFGNALILYHAPGIYSLLGHLRAGSIKATLGQHVGAGQALAECGASGRSPRPHLHFQVQASPELFAPTLQFRLTHYLEPDREKLRYRRAGLPQEGDLVQTIAAEPSLAAFAELPSSRELRLHDAAGDEIVIVCQGSVERYLLDRARGTRLYFVSTPQALIFTSLDGAGPLASLFRALPLLPTAHCKRLSFSERLPAAPFLPLALRWLYQLLQPFADPLTIEVDCTFEQNGDRTAVRSHSHLRIGSLRYWHRRGCVEFDRFGLESIELATQTGDSLFRAARHRSPNPSFDGEEPCAISRC